MAPEYRDFLTDSPTFRYRRIDAAGAPEFDPTIIDIALLDMNHDWPNLGHDSIVQSVHEAVDAIEDELLEKGLAVRVLSFDVRKSLLLPEPSSRYLLYIGTGGPGHLDPRENDGEKEGAQGIKEDPAWEPRLWALLDWIKANEEAALLAICHTFGLVCRWSGIAEPKLRGANKGGKSNGIVTNKLTEFAQRHRWFGSLSTKLPDTRTFQVLDNRLYDLAPLDVSGVDVLAYENDDRDALTVVQLAADRRGMPRMLAMNHHPEIIDRAHLRRVLDEKLERGEVTQSWYDERANAFRDLVANATIERSMQLTSHFTWLGPLQYQLQRIVRLRAAENVPQPAFA